MQNKVCDKVDAVRGISFFLCLLVSKTRRGYTTESTTFNPACFLMLETGRGYTTESTAFNLACFFTKKASENWVKNTPQSAISSILHAFSCLKTPHGKAIENKTLGKAIENKTSFAILLIAILFGAKKLPADLFRRQPFVFACVFALCFCFVFLLVFFYLYPKIFLSASSPATSAAASLLAFWIWR